MYRRLVTSMFLCSVFLMILSLFSAGTVLAVEPPKTIGTITLGSDISDYPDIQYTNYLKEKIVVDWHGYKKGIVSLGMCVYPNTILRIRLKYENSSKGFYKKLLKEFKKRFGTDAEWKGDSFGILHAWKWKFVDKNNDIVHLILQHNSKDKNQTIGNQVKLFYPAKIEEERLCFIKTCEEANKAKSSEQQTILHDDNWQLMIPQ